MYGVELHVRESVPICVHCHALETAAQRAGCVQVLGRRHKIAVFCELSRSSAIGHLRVATRARRCASRPPLTAMISPPRTTRRPVYCLPGRLFTALPYAHALISRRGVFVSFIVHATTSKSISCEQDHHTLHDGLLRVWHVHDWRCRASPSPPRQGRRDYIKARHQSVGRDSRTKRLAAWQLDVGQHCSAMGELSGQGRA